ncbi:tyrosine-type recombinase/integrase [Sinorhizobium meliloti]|uniref:tyrosine-type recombinase/integrase n=1 Tax=Rhizobium meliloti TaxID=382 RepID=UPI000FDB54CF|nr:site-specific integrase [Sinorhizobium meliloti]RVG45617.1 site-specific integrase [Sinorhizobium meliloti]WQP06266.1 site-specific integrase [Sinorhizobium meliloti]WQP33067.1 site-specific integrase [Sinorhizobium meliloti]
MTKHNGKAMLSTMPKKVDHKLPKGVSLDRDFRTREPRYYFRAPGKKKVRLRETPGTAEFEKEVACARLGVAFAPAGQEQLSHTALRRQAAEGSVDWLFAEYKRRVQGSINATLLARRSTILEDVCDYKFGSARCGDLPYADMRKRHVLEIRDAIRDKPGARNDVKRTISAMFSWAVESDLASVNPASQIKLLYSGDGFHTWTIGEVRQFEAKHPIGSKARLMLHLALYTGLRLNSLAILGRQHIRNGTLTIRPEKTRKSSGVTVEIPVLPELQKTIDESSTGNLTFLVTEFNKPFTVNGLGNKMRDWCDQAELFHCTTHGLRKAGATIAAENGATDEELMAIFGWTTKNQTTTYTKKARRKKMAAGAMRKLLPEGSEGI